MGTLAFQFGRKIYRAKSRRQVKVLLLRLRRKRIYACFLGVFAKFTTRNPGASAKFPTGKLTPAKPTKHQSPPPPLYGSWMYHARCLNSCATQQQGA